MATHTNNSSAMRTQRNRSNHRVAEWLGDVPTGGSPSAAHSHNSVVASPAPSIAPSDAISTAPFRSHTSRTFRSRSEASNSFDTPSNSSVSSVSSVSSQYFSSASSATSATTATPEGYSTWDPRKRWPSDMDPLDMSDLQGLSLEEYEEKLQQKRQRRAPVASNTADILPHLRNDDLDLLSRRSGSSASRSRQSATSSASTVYSPQSHTGLAPIFQYTTLGSNSSASYPQTFADARDSLSGTTAVQWSPAPSSYASARMDPHPLSPQSVPMNYPQNPGYGNQRHGYAHPTSSRASSSVSAVHPPGHDYQSGPPPYSSQHSGHRHQSSARSGASSSSRYTASFSTTHV